MDLHAESKKAFQEFKVNSVFIKKYGCKCKKCGKETLWLEDVDYIDHKEFDEYIGCSNCENGYIVKIRNGLIVNIK